MVPCHLPRLQLVTCRSRIGHKECCKRARIWLTLHLTCCEITNVLRLFCSFEMWKKWSVGAPRQKRMPPPRIPHQQPMISVFITSGHSAYFDIIVKLNYLQQSAGIRLSNKGTKVILIPLNDSYLSFVHPFLSQVVKYCALHRDL